MVLVQQIELEMNFQTANVLTYIFESSFSNFHLCLKLLLRTFGWKEVGLDEVEKIEVLDTKTQKLN